MRRLTREEWLWYAAYPLGGTVGLLVFGWLIANGPLFTEIIIPTSVGGAVILFLYGWWMIHWGKHISKRAVDLSVLGLLASVVIGASRYALVADVGTLYVILETASAVGFVPGFLCGFYYFASRGAEAVAGQKSIIAGWLSLIYVGFGSYSVRNIGSEIFRIDLFPPPVWLWLGRAGIEASALFTAVGIQLTRKFPPVATSEKEETRKGRWGEALQAFTFPLTIAGVFLSAYSFSVLGGLVAIIVGVLLYPAGWIVTILLDWKKSKAHEKGKPILTA